MYLFYLKNQLIYLKNEEFYLHKLSVYIIIVCVNIYYSIKILIGLKKKTKKCSHEKKLKIRKWSSYIFLLTDYKNGRYFIERV